MFKKDTEKLVSGNFTFHDIDPDNECNFDEAEAKRIEIEKAKSKKREKDINSYFNKSKKSNDRFKMIKSKESKKSLKQKNKDEELSNINKNKIFVYRGIKFIKVEEFIEYLDNNYLEIDEISKEVLNSENFLAWLSKESKVFDESIRRFREIKEKIEKK